MNGGWIGWLMCVRGRGVWLGKGKVGRGTLIELVVCEGSVRKWWHQWVGRFRGTGGVVGCSLKRSYMLEGGGWCCLDRLGWWKDGVVLRVS